MKYSINKTEFEALTEDAQKEYTLEGEQATLVIDGGPDFEKLESKLKIEVDHRKKAEGARDSAEARAAQIQEDFSKAGGNTKKIEELEAKHTAELEKLRGEREAEQAANIARLDTEMVQAEATKFATEHFTIPGVMVDQFAKRLAVEEVEGKRVVRVRDAEGNASAMGLSDLQKEFLDNKEFAPIIKANVGTGGGASPTAGGGATKPGKDLSLTEQVALKKSNPEQFAALFPNQQTA